MYKKYKKITALFLALIVFICCFQVSAITAGVVAASSTADLPFSEGVYYIKNAELDNYIQIDNNEAPQYDESGAFLELWGLDEGDYQKWNLVYLGDGYYKIESVISGLVISVQSDETNSDEVKLVQEDYAGLDRQQWAFEETNSGSYIIRPRSGESYTKDWCMAAGDGLITANGRNVEQREYSNNSDYKDAWILEPTKDKAIFIIPGILGSSLEMDDGADVWLNAVNCGKMELNENGTSVNDIVSVNYDNYGANNTYETLYESLYDAYSDNFDVIFFDYDFRLSIDTAATKLAIETSFYDEVVLVGHSMGGLVASKYLMNSSTHRSKTDVLITLGTPYAGSAKCINVMETGEMLSINLAGIDVPLFTNTIKNMSKNCYSAYQLLPTSDYYDLTECYPVTVNGISHSDAITHLKNTAWGKTSNGGEKLMFNAAQAFHSSLYGNGTYITDYDDVTVYEIAGIGHDTISTVNLDSNYEIDSLTYSNNGDGTVLFYSAGHGHPSYSYVAGHTGMVSSTSVISKVKQLISNVTGISATSTSNELSLYNTTNANSALLEEVDAEHVENEIRVNGRGWIENLDNRRINIYTDLNSMLSVDGVNAVECNGVVYNVDGEQIGSVWQLGNSGRKMYALYDGIYQIVNATELKIEYMDSGYYDLIAEYNLADYNNMIVSVGNYSTKEIAVHLNSDITSEVIALQPSHIYSENELTALNSDSN